MPKTPAIEYIAPTSRAIGRMTTILFRPFDIGKWFTLGFTAFLASLMDGGHSSNSSFNDSSGESGGLDEIIEPVKSFVEENLAMVIGIGAIVVVLVIVICVVFLWLSSRGKFMFLDNVIYDRALVKLPWHEYRTVGNSLFCWRLGFGLICFFAVIIIGGGSAYLLYQGYNDGDFQAGWIVGLVAAIIVMCGLLIAIAYISLLLEDFVIPMMYRDGLHSSAAWQRVLALQKINVGKFIIYALWRLAIGFAIGIVIIIAIIATCCIGLILLIIPYIGAVFLLPITVFSRALGPEFLRQFGDDYDVWHNSDAHYGIGPGQMPDSSF